MRGRTPITRQATLNGKHFRSTWLVFHFSVVSPHPSRAAPGPPSPQGKAASRRGSLTFPWGKVPPQRRKRGGTGLILGPAPHPSGLRPATLSQERVFPLIRPGLRPVHLPRGGRLPPAPLPSPGGRYRRSGGRGAVPGRFWVRPHTRQGYALPPSPRSGFFPSSVPGCTRSTFPVGEGFLRRGCSLPSLWLFKQFFRLPPLRIPYCVVK